MKTISNKTYQDIKRNLPLFLASVKFDNSNVNVANAERLLRIAVKKFK